MSGQSVSIKTQDQGISAQPGSRQAEKKSSPEGRAAFSARFRRCQTLLCFIAGQILDGTENVDEAMRNCWLAASRNPPNFEYETAFRRWLLRILIDEALAIRCRATPLVQ